jgi:hypothetical protein
MHGLTCKAGREWAHPATAAGLWLVTLLLGCAPLGSQASRARHENPLLADTALFRLVVQAIPTLPRVPVRVDPRVLRVDQELHGNEPRHDGDLHVSLDELRRLIPQSIFFPDSTDLVRVPRRVLRMRSRVLRDLGVRETNALHDAGCPGVLVPIRPGRDTSACSRDGQFTSAILSEPREGGAYWPGVIDERAAGKERGEWTIRVTERGMDPTGSATDAVDYVVRRDVATRRWRLVKRVGLIIVE